ncbi:FtsX-like permease family protein [Streptomyces varsoviensis]|uniref:FtsX-like permease family protein n=1 Tax=Streptomyces varsoviensis TaxID=67373 RepID=UPI0004C4A0D5|nr:FtsX-like permease family protein [Streptomyces varsoviensis]
MSATRAPQGGTNGLARAAIRFKPASFVGTFVALLMAAMIVSACGILLETGIRASVPPERYAGAPVVAAADQKAHYVIGHGEDRETESEPLPDTARLDASLVGKVAHAPGVQAAIGDVGYPAHLTGAKTTGRAAAPVTAHGWGSAAFTGAELATGSAPRAGQAVLDTATARAAHIKAGDRVTLNTPAGARDVTVAGTARTAAPTAWLTDAQAVQVSGHPGKIDAVAVLPTAGTSTDRLADSVRQAVGKAAQVHTGDDRGAVEQPALAGAKETLMGLGGSFGGVATMVAIFTAAGTVALSVGQRAREFALLRAIGATPRQVRRSIAAEALLVAPLAGALGCLPGIALARWWFGQLKEKGVVPDAVRLGDSGIPLVAAVGVGLLTALCAGAAAARRPARIKPGQALGEAAVERSRPGPVRTALGAAALVGGVVLAILAATLTGDDAANTASGVVMLFMLGVALLGPLVARLCAHLIGLPLRAGPAAAHLASANSRANARRLASAITPIVLAMAFASTLVFMHTSEDHARAAQQRAGITADHVISAPGGLPTGTAAKAAATPGVETAVGLLRTSVLYTSSTTDGPLTASTQGVGGTGADLRAVQDLDVRAGSLDALGPGKVAVAANLADGADVKVGDRLSLVLPDGTKARPEVVATYGRGLGVAQVTMVRTALAPHVTAGFDSDVLVRDARGADARQVAGKLAALGEVTDRAGYAAAKDKDREVSAWANTLMAAVLGGFAAVAAVNTLVMTVFDRRRELGTLRLIGSTRRQVLGMVRWEALLVAFAGIVLGTAIALATLVPMMRGLTGAGPYIPPLLYGSFAAGALVLGLAATSLPARAVLRRR